MKVLFRSLLAFSASACLLATVPAQAQTFSNSTLDNWAVRGNIEAPTNWQTTDDVVQALLKLRLPTNTVTKTNVVRSGAFAAQLQTQAVTVPGQAPQNVPGIMFLGNSLSGGADLPGGLPFTARPANLQFYYQLSGAQALKDSAGVLVQLTRRINGNPVVVAQGSFLFPALAATYTLATVPLQYLANVTPDSVSIAFGSGFAESVTAGTILRVDDIIFTGGTATATRDAAMNAAVSVFPNPSPDGHYVLNTTEPALLAAPLTVFDATGRVVRRENALKLAAATRPLDLSALPGGIYTVQLATPRGLVTRKLTR
jgi:hypothetical protein